MSYHPGILVPDDELPEFLRSQPGRVSVYAPSEPDEMPLPAPQLIRNHLDEIALLVKSITYGDFMDLAAGIGADPAVLWKWATK